MAQKICADILANMNNKNKDLSTVDMLSHLNTNLSDIPATIDEFGNVTRKIASYAGGSQNDYLSRQQYANPQLGNSNGFMRTTDLFRQGQDENLNQLNFNANQSRP